MSQTTFPPLGPTVLTQTIPAYVYQEYADDDNIQALNSGYNGTTQQYVTWFSSVALAVYTSPQIVGTLLDWVATNLYGFPRPVLPSGTTTTIGAVGTFPPDELPPNTLRHVGNATFYAVDDDIYKRCLTWNFYKGDGRTFSIAWLKRRIYRFLFGPSGTAPTISQTYQISVSFGAGNQVNIILINGITKLLHGSAPNLFPPNTRPPNQFATTYTPLPTQLPNTSVLQACINAGVLQLPFQFQWVVVIENGPNSATFTNVSGVLHVSTGAGYPTSATGLPAGDVWSNAGVVTVVGGITPNPTAPPLYLASTTPVVLLAVGGGNLPLTAGVTGSGQLWNNSGVVNVS